MSPGRLGGRSEMMMPIPMPRGLARANTMVEMTKLRMLRLDWAMLRPRLKAISAL